MSLYISFKCISNLCKPSSRLYLTNSKVQGVWLKQVLLFFDCLAINKQVHVCSFHLKFSYCLFKISLCRKLWKTATPFNIIETTIDIGRQLWKENPKEDISILDFLICFSKPPISTEHYILDTITMKKKSFRVMIVGSMMGYVSFLWIRSFTRLLASFIFFDNNNWIRYFLITDYSVQPLKVK